MIKDDLMKALKSAVSDYNGGLGANESVVKAAEAMDFNDKQTDRLVEMFNTAAVLAKEASGDPAGACELADKGKVAAMIVKGASAEKTASAELDYSFYDTDPVKTNPCMEARAAGMSKAASDIEVKKPEEADVSQRSLYRIIDGRINIVKRAGEAAAELASALRIFVDDEAEKMAEFMERYTTSDDVVDMFKVACPADALEAVCERSPRLKGSSGGRYAKMEVFDGSAVEDLVKRAQDISSAMSEIKPREASRDAFLSKAAEAKDAMLSAVGLKKEAAPKSLSDMYCGNAPRPESRSESGLESDGSEKKAFDLSGAQSLLSHFDTVKDLSSSSGMGDEVLRLLNDRRAMILADLMTNDPILRDVDPDVISEAYKTMVMAAPRVSLDKAQARAFLRSASTTVAISPADTKMITDVDKGMQMSSIGRLSGLDSSIRDSNA